MGVVHCCYPVFHPSFASRGGSSPSRCSRADASYALRLQLKRMGAFCIPRTTLIVVITLVLDNMSLKVIGRIDRTMFRRLLVVDRLLPLQYHGLIRQVGHR